MTLIFNTCVWILLLTAVARPQWIEDPIERTVPTRDMLLLVDLSGSMQHEDFKDPSGNPIDRLTALKSILGDFLLQREGDRVGLVVFGSSAFLQVPLTTDLELCKRLLDETAVGMAGPKTALGDAIGFGIQMLTESDSPEKTMIAVTDGNDTSSKVPPIEASRVARDREITIHTVAIGDPTTVGEEKLDEEALKTVSSTTGGNYFLALDADALKDVYAELDQIETTEVKTVSHRPRTDLYFWPVLLALVLSLLVHAWPIWSAARTSLSAAETRVRVNSRTFELEVSDD